MTEEQKRISRKNKQLAWEHFYPEGNGKAKKGYVLHHIDPSWRHNNVERYILWDIKDLMLMSLSEHSKLHNSGKNNPFFGKRHTDETKHKISETKKGKPNPHKGPSEEVRKKISEALKGTHHIITEETKHKISEANKGKHHTEESRKKMSEAKKGKPSTFAGKHHSEETRRKMSESHKRRFAL